MEFTRLRNGLLTYIGLFIVLLILGQMDLFGMLSLVAVSCLIVYLIFKKTNWSIVGILLYAIFIKAIENYFGVRHIFSYLVDIFLGLLFFKSIFDIYNRKIRISKYLKHLGILITGYFLISLLFLIEAGLYITNEDVENVKKVLFFLLPFNVLISGIQLIGLHLSPDYVGGIFGCTKGVNGYTNIYLCLLTVFLLMDYALGKISLKKTILVIILVLLNATFAELKYYFIEFIIFMVFMLFVSENRKKYFKAMAISFFLLIIGMNILYLLFPFFKNFFSIEKIQSYLSSGYTGRVGEINRLSAYTMINQHYLLDWIHRLFGIGFGMAETSSSFSFLQSPFYLANGWIRYDWFSHAFIYIETGLIGTFAYFAIILYCGGVALKKYLNPENYLDKQKTFVTLGIIVIVFMNFIYNSSLRTEAGYMVYFFLVIPFIANRTIKVTAAVNEDKKISVIVPVYNVEKYLKRCVDSILSQKYKNLEIILVDDGSKDQSGRICDEYLEKDNRIKVIHKVNGGLSDARNAGIDIATGDYLAFVDSDDFIASDMYTFLINSINKTRAKIAICNKKYFYANEKITLKPINYVTETVMSSYEALKKLNQLDQIDVSMCDKLFEKTLFGKKSEDSFVCYKLFYMAKELIYMPETFYFYFQRSGSITDGVNFNRDVLDAAQQQIAFFNEKYPSLVKYGVIYKIILILTIMKK